MAAAHLGWSIPQLRETRRRAQELGWIEMIANPVKGRNALYRWDDLQSEPTKAKTHGILGVEI
jgi:hypothetical protein